MRDRDPIPYPGAAQPLPFQEHLQHRLGIETDPSHRKDPHQFVKNLVLVPGFQFL